MKELTIRKSSENDYDAMAAVWTLAYPGYPMTSERLRHWDEHRDEKCAMVRLVGELAGAPEAGIIGVAEYYHESHMYHPRKYQMDIGVLPEHQGQGFGKALYKALMSNLGTRDPLLVRACGREGNERVLRFLADRGFVEEIREWEARLDVTAFDFARYEGLDTKMREQGIELTCMADLRGEPGFERKLYDLVMALLADVPAPEAHTPETFEAFEARVFSNPSLLPEAYTIAVHDGELIGVSVLLKIPADETIQTGLTGVRREYRRKGIATAMKVRGIRWCARHGYTAIRTENEQNNVGMLSINESLGFVRQPAWIGHVKALGREPSSERPFVEIWERTV